MYKDCNSCRSYNTVLCAIDDLPEPKISDLMNKVASKAKGKWTTIGTQLKIEWDEIQAISQRYQNPSDCYTEMFCQWKKKGDPPFTWATIVKVLRTDSVRENKVADSIVEWLKNN